MRLILRNKWRASLHFLATQAQAFGSSIFRFSAIDTLPSRKAMEMSELTTDAAGESRPDRTRATRTLTVTGLNHALHDGYTDLIYVLLPVWQTEFALSYGLLAVLRGLYAGTMAGLQIPVGRFAERVDGKTILMLGTL